MTYSTVNNIKLIVSVIYATKTIVDMLKDFFKAPIQSDFNSMFESPASRVIPRIKQMYIDTMNFVQVQIAKFTSLPYMLQSTLRVIAELSLIGLLLLCGLSSYILYVEILMLLVTAYFAIIQLLEWYANR